MGSVLNNPKQPAYSSWPIYCLTVKQWKKKLGNQHLNLGKTQLRSNPVIYGTNLNLSV